MLKREPAAERQNKRSGKHDKQLLAKYLYFVYVCEVDIDQLQKIASVYRLSRVLYVKQKLIQGAEKSRYKPYLGVLYPVPEEIVIFQRYGVERHAKEHAGFQAHYYIEYFVMVVVAIRARLLQMHIQFF